MLLKRQAESQKSERAAQPRVCTDASKTFHAWPRLSEILLKTTWQQTELEVEDDLTALNEWAKQFDLFSKQQAHMASSHIQ